jgi:hypothetical protein
MSPHNRVINQQNTKKKKNREVTKIQRTKTKEKKKEKKKKSRETEDQPEESCSSTPVLSATRSARKSIALSLASNYTW